MTGASSFLLNEMGQEEDTLVRLLIKEGIEKAGPAKTAETLSRNLDQFVKDDPFLVEKVKEARNSNKSDSQISNALVRLFSSRAVNFTRYGATTDPTGVSEEEQSTYSDISNFEDIGASRKINPGVFVHSNPALQGYVREAVPKIGSLGELTKAKDIARQFAKEMASREAAVNVLQGMRQKEIGLQNLETAWSQGQIPKDSLDPSEIRNFLGENSSLREQISGKYNNTQITSAINELSNMSTIDPMGLHHKGLIASYDEALGGKASYIFKYPDKALEAMGQIGQAILGIPYTVTKELVDSGDTQYFGVRVPRPWNVKNKTKQIGDYVLFQSPEQAGDYSQALLQSGGNYNQVPPQAFGGIPATQAFKDSSLFEASISKQWSNGDLLRFDKYVPVGQRFNKIKNDIVNWNLQTPGQDIIGYALENAGSNAFKDYGLVLLGNATDVAAFDLPKVYMGIRMKQKAADYIKSAESLESYRRVAKVYGEEATKEFNAKMERMQQGKAPDTLNEFFRENDWQNYLEEQGKKPLQLPPATVKTRVSSALRDAGQDVAIQLPEISRTAKEGVITPPPEVADLKRMLEYLQAVEKSPEIAPKTETYEPVFSTKQGTETLQGFLNQIESQKDYPAYTFDQIQMLKSIRQQMQKRVVSPETGGVPESLYELGMDAVLDDASVRAWMKANEWLPVKGSSSNVKIIKKGKK